MPSFTTDQAPDQVLARLAAYADDWHESRLPEALRTHGGYGFKFRQSPDGRFYLGLLRGALSRSSYAVRGAVAPGAAGGAVVTFDVGLDRRSRASWAMLATIASIVIGGGVALGARLDALAVALLFGGAAGLVIVAEHWTGAPVRAALLEVPARAIALPATTASIGVPPA